MVVSFYWCGVMGKIFEKWIGKEWTLCHISLFNTVWKFLIPLFFFHTAQDCEVICIPQKKRVLERQLEFYCSLLSTLLNCYFCCFTFSRTELKHRFKDTSKWLLMGFQQTWVPLPNTVPNTIPERFLFSDTSSH